MSILTDWISENLVLRSWDDYYEGIKEPSLAELGALQALVHEASESAQILSLKHRKRELETEVSDLRNTLVALRNGQVSYTSPDGYSISRNMDGDGLLLKDGEPIGVIKDLLPHI